MEGDKKQNGLTVPILKSVKLDMSGQRALDFLMKNLKSNASQSIRAAIIHYALHVKRSQYLD